ncbi:MAG: hypothetical protein GF311_17705 [Candidatus Lokiarchaeota archaeon]|nr:hypothetical protein [Candidatus Lokiarchaeota archaeon]
MKQKIFILLKLILLASLIETTFDTFLAPFLFNFIPNNLPYVLVLPYGIIELCCLIMILISLIFFQYLKIYPGIIIGLFASFVYIVFVIPIDFMFINLMNNSIKTIFLIYSILFPFQTTILIFIVNNLMLRYKINEQNIDIGRIKKNVIDLGTKFTRLTLGDVSEKCKENKDIILKVITEMIENNEVYAKYFKSTQMIAFDQQANLNEIDELLNQFNEWEKNQQLKKV